MRNPFDASTWDAHKISKSHMDNAVKLGICARPEKELPTRPSSTRSIRVKVKALSQGEYSTRPRTAQSPVVADAHTRSDRSEVLVKVIDSLSSLVSEQQDDIHELRGKLRTMHREMATMVSAFQDVHDSQFQLSQSVCSYLNETSSQSSQALPARRSRRWTYERRHSHNLRSKASSSQSFDTEDTDSSSTDMSIAESASQLTQMD